MKNRWLGVIVPCLLIILTHSALYAKNAPPNDIRITVPHNVIIQMIKSALPLMLEKGPYLKGNLWIQSIDNLKIGSDRVMFNMNIRGQNIKFETQLGDQAVLMNIGDIDAAFFCNAALRYDPSRRLLYVNPQIQQQQSQNPSNRVEANLLQLLSLGNGVEHPIEIGELEPIITPIAGEHFNIEMDITNIQTARDALLISIRPKVQKVKPPAAKKK